MTRKIWNKFGWLGFWLAWPILHIIIRSRERTRVLVVYDKEVLVVMDWLGAGKWSLPGGGLHKNELPADGALRELHEETGIVLGKDQLEYLGKKHAVNDEGHNYTYHAFAVRLKYKQDLKRQSYELREVAWTPVDKLLSDKRLGKIPREIIETWFGK